MLRLITILLGVGYVLISILDDNIILYKFKSTDNKINFHLFTLILLFLIFIKIIVYIFRIKIYKSNLLFDFIECFIFSSVIYIFTIKNIVKHNN